MIRALCLDFDGTLAHFTGDYTLLIGELRHKLGLTLCDVNTLAQRRAAAERQDGAMTFADTVRAAFASLRLRPPDDLDTLCQETVRDYASEMTLLPGALELLAMCRSRAVPLALITNGPSDMQRAAIGAVGIASYFSSILVSGDAEVAVRKPHPRIFRQASTALGVLPQEVLMVGDTPEADVRGAVRAGMQAVLLAKDPVADLLTLSDLAALRGWLEASLPR